MTVPSAPRVRIPLDRSAGLPLMDQISTTLRDAVRSGQLAPGTRLPSWRDLATQLGVSRGTVRAAYERLLDERLIISAGPSGTFVADEPVDGGSAPSPLLQPPMRDFMPTFSEPVRPFQLGVPAQDAFPATLWARLGTLAARRQAAAPTSYPDPRGEPELRREIATYLAVARGIRAHPDQVIVTNGYRSALGLVIRSLQLEGRAAWMEEPGFPIARICLDLANIACVAVRVDAEGLDVEQGIALVPDAALAVVTPSQQAPLGMALSPRRRAMLLDWAKATNAWVIEDDYLGELQLDGRAAPALAAADKDGRVLHIGSFSKSIAPSVAMGFVLVPPALADRFAQIAAYHYPAPGTLIQHQVAAFMANGHYLRHLRRMKRLYRMRRDALAAALIDRAPRPAGCLALLLALPAACDDVALCEAAYARGIAPLPLSSWYMGQQAAQRGLILCVANCMPSTMAGNVATLSTLVRAQA